MHYTHTVDIQLPAAQVMSVTGHKSEVQMRRDYLPPEHQKKRGRNQAWILGKACEYGRDGRREPGASPAANVSPVLLFLNNGSTCQLQVYIIMSYIHVTSTVSKYANGELPRLPLTTVELYGKIVDQARKQLC